ncbi:MAG TPA: nicotinate-nucleotide adenylyltransferase [Hyphomicrobiaceae bacterium]|nr:nicotinate-nucleotide adenylyltransferase [Hyphomicrobiaceae bacterium]
MTHVGRVRGAERRARRPPAERNAVRKSVHSSFGSIRVKPPLVLPGQRIGVMGGTFNPPHAGHLLVSRSALRRLALHQVWWVVTPGNPLKGNEDLPDLCGRMDLCRRLAADRRVRVTGFEETLRTPYTAVTLAFLRRRFPRVRFVWIMGADNLAGFHRWQDWRRIAAIMPIAVVDRPGWRLKALASRAAHALARAYLPESRALTLPLLKPPAWTFITGPLSHLSSTELRRTLRITPNHAIP